MGDTLRNGAKRYARHIATTNWWAQSSNEFRCGVAFDFRFPGVGNTHFEAFVSMSGALLIKAGCDRGFKEVVLKQPNLMPTHATQQREFPDGNRAMSTPTTSRVLHYFTAHCNQQPKDQSQNRMLSLLLPVWVSRLSGSLSCPLRFRAKLCIHQHERQGSEIPVQ